MKVFNLHPLLFSDTMALLILLLRPVKIIQYLDLKSPPAWLFPIGPKTFLSVERSIVVGEKFSALGRPEEKDCNVLFSHDKLLKFGHICAA